MIQKFLALLLLCVAGAHAQVPVPADDSASTESLRAILGLRPDQPLVPVTEPTTPHVKYDVEFTTHDGVVIRGDYSHTPLDPEAPVIIVLHDMRTNRRELGNLPRFLLDTGYSVLTYDMRGFGESTKRADGSPFLEPEEAQRDARKYYNDMIGDVPQAIDWLEENGLVKKGGVYIIGRRVGALVAGMALSRNVPRLRGAILEAPPSGLVQIDLLKGLSTVQGRPILFLAGQNDNSAQTTLRLAREQAAVQPAIIPDAGSRDNLLVMESTQEEILKFLP